MKTLIALSLLAAVVLCFATLYVAKTIAEAQTRRVQSVENIIER